MSVTEKRTPSKLYFNDFANIKNYFFLTFSSLGTANYKEHFSVAASVPTRVLKKWF